MLHQMYRGDSSQRQKAAQNMTDEIFTKAQLEDTQQLSFERFVDVISLNPYARLFFQLGDKDSLEALVQKLWAGLCTDCIILMLL